MFTKSENKTSLSSGIIKSLKSPEKAQVVLIVKNERCNKRLVIDYSQRHLDVCPLPNTDELFEKISGMKYTTNQT